MASLENQPWSNSNENAFLKHVHFIVIRSSSLLFDYVSNQLFSSVQFHKPTLKEVIITNATELVDKTTDRNFKTIINYFGNPRLLLTPMFLLLPVIRDISDPPPLYLVNPNLDSSTSPLALVGKEQVLRTRLLESARSKS